MRKRHVLLPLDGSEFGRHAFRAVGRLFDPAITRVTLAHVARVAPQARVFELSARTGAGLPAWLDYLRGQRRAKRDRWRG